jgi:hypothetical protein
MYTILVNVCVCVRTYKFMYIHACMDGKGALGLREFYGLLAESDVNVYTCMYTKHTYIHSYFLNRMEKVHSVCVNTADC